MCSFIRLKPLAAAVLTGALVVAVSASVDAAPSRVRIIGGEDTARRLALVAELRALDLQSADEPEVSSIRVAVDDGGVIRLFAQSPDGRSTLRDAFADADDGIAARRAAEAIRALIAAGPGPAEASPFTDSRPGTPLVAVDAADAKRQPETMRAAILLNPLGAGFGRFSVQVDVMVTRHHALTVNPFFFYSPAIANGDVLGARLAVGGELGYRFYTGSRGPNGFFVGSSVIVGRTWTTAKRRVGEDGPLWGRGLRDLAVGEYEPFWAVGGAVDVGAQFLLGPGAVVGFGAGVQYLVHDEDVGVSGAFSGLTRHFAPRLLLSVGFGR